MSSRSRWQQFFGSRWFLILGTVFLIFLLVGYGRMYYQNYLVNKEIARLELEAQNVRAKKSQMLEMLEYSKSQSFVEKQARLELNLVKDGEHVVMVKKLAGTDGGEGRQKNKLVVESEEVFNPLAWWRYFFH